MQAQNETDSFFYETKQARKPRCVFVDFADNIGPTPWSAMDLPDPKQTERQVFEGQLMEADAGGQRPQPSQDAASDPEPEYKSQFRQQLKLNQKIEASDFHRKEPEDEEIADSVALFNEWNENKGSRFIREPRKKFQVREQFHMDIREIDQQQLTLFYNLPKFDQLYYKFYESKDLELVFDQLQTQLEKCDSVDGFSLFENSQSNLSQFSTDVINYIQDECSKSPLLIFDCKSQIESKTFKFPLQYRFNSILQQIDTENTHQIIFPANLSAKLYEETAIPALMSTCLFNCAFEGGYCMDSLQRGMVVSPKLRYLQSQYYLYDHSSYITNIVCGTKLTDYEKKVREINASYAVMCCSGYNPEEVNLDQCLYQTSDVIPEFCRELAKLQHNPISLQDYIIG